MIVFSRGSKLLLRIKGMVFFLPNITKRYILEVKQVLTLINFKGIRNVELHYLLLNTRALRILFKIWLPIYRYRTWHFTVDNASSCCHPLQVTCPQGSLKNYWNKQICNKTSTNNTIWCKKKLNGRTICWMMVNNVPVHPNTFA